MLYHVSQPSHSMMSLFIVTAGIIREFLPALGDFVQHKGIELLMHCLSSDCDKLVIKALFLLTSICNSISDHINGQLLWYFNNVPLPEGVKWNHDCIFH